MKRFFAPISKINKQTRQVEGVLALEVIDKDGEIMDYDTSKPYFEKWSQEIHRASGGKSLGNVRVMHQAEIGGKLVELNFDDVNKMVTAVSNVTEDKAWKQILDGTLNGFSIGGNVKSRSQDKQLKAKRYTVEPYEVSLVDNPCMYGADFTLITENGAAISQKFAGGNRETDIKIEEEPDELDFKNIPEPITKSMYDVARIADNISSLQYLSIPDAVKPKFIKAVNQLFSVLKGMANVEQDNFKSSLDQLVNAVDVVKSVGLEAIKGEEMEKFKLADAVDSDEFQDELVEKVAKDAKVTKAVAKTVIKHLGPQIQEMLEDAMEDVYKTVNQVVKTVNTLGGQPQKTRVVTKAADRKRRSEEDEEETPEKLTKIAPLTRTSDRNDPELLKITKAALARPIRQEEEPEEEEEETEE